MSFKLPWWRLALGVLGPALVGAWIVANWSTTSVGTRAFATAMLALAWVSLLRDPYQMELRSDGTVAFQTMLGERVLTLQGMTLIAARRRRGRASIVVRGTTGLVRVPISMPGIAELIEAARATNPDVLIEGRF